ncbi:MAG: hypothetical protein IMZ67_09175 [Acidobacteria bacterium]|nr:hypothetical protein [Acidobacteriota bacterium]
MKTFSPDSWNAAQDAWTDGEFSSEWRDARHVMAMNGCIYPPTGTRFDSWEDDAPSQRAILIRAIRETPGLLATSMRGAPSWSKVIERLMRARDDWRDEMRAEEGDDTDRVVDRSAPVTIAAVLKRIADSGWTSPEEQREQERLERMAAAQTPVAS